ncbi:uncharacterized protein [Panulirus ornatus]|uniref:uncharacterized protein n=1 Tax=Panulirus ornatus TaxID=150431 RepID=UPI003A8921F8
MMWYCGRAEQPLWRRWRLGLPLLLLNIVLTQGVIYENPSLQEVLSLRKDWTRLCVEAQNPGSKLELQLVVGGGGPGREVETVLDSVAVRKKWLPVDEARILTVRHYTTGKRKHKMQVFLGERKLPNDEDPIKAFYQQAQQWKISIYVKGKIKIEVCPDEEATTPKQPTVLPPTTIKTPGPPPPPATTPTVASKMPTGKASQAPLERREEFLHLAEDEGMESTTFEDSGITTANVNATNNATESPKTEEEWWSFLMRDAGGVPILALLLICLVVGAVIGALIALLCARRRKKELHYRKVRRSMPRPSDHLDVIINPRSYNTSDKKSTSDFGSLGSRRGIPLNPSFTSADLRSNSIHSRMSNMNDLNFSSKNSSNNNSIDSNHLRANFPNVKHKNGITCTPRSEDSNTDNTSASTKLNISYPIMNGVYSIPHETEAELLPLKTETTNNNNYDDVKEKQFGTFRKFRP